VSEPLVYRVPEVAELLGCGTSTVYDAIARGEIPGVLKVGRRLMVSKAAFHRALELDGGEGRQNGGGEHPPAA
jgi:excisionase family DNA binding protein